MSTKINGRNPPSHPRLLPYPSLPRLREISIAVNSVFSIFPLTFDDGSRGMGWELGAQLGGGGGGVRCSMLTVAFFGWSAVFGADVFARLIWLFSAFLRCFAWGGGDDVFFRDGIFKGESWPWPSMRCKLSKVTCDERFEWVRFWREIHRIFAQEIYMRCIF